MRPMTRFELSATQLVATALAAITATVAASFLGVTGTVIGAALASVVSAIGTAVYAHSLRSTRARVRGAVPPGSRTLADPAATAVSTVPASRERVRADVEPAGPAPQRRWHNVAVGSIALFVAILTIVTGVEVVTGRPLSDLVRGDSGSGTSVFGTTGDAAGREPATVPTVTQTVTPSVVVVTPTVTQTAPAVTETSTPTNAATSSEAPVPSATPTESSATPAPSGQPTP